MSLLFVPDTKNIHKPEAVNALRPIVYKGRIYFSLTDAVRKLGITRPALIDKINTTSGVDTFFIEDARMDVDRYIWGAFIRAGAVSIAQVMKVTSNSYRLIFIGYKPFPQSFESLAAANEFACELLRNGHIKHVKPIL